MMYLVSATPGTGKSCWVVKQITQWIEDPANAGRKIYSNIAGLKIEGVEVPPDDFRECPDGSIIVYDEAQEIEHYSSDSRANNPVSKALSKHRHRGFDIWFITQDPSLLHKYVLKNIYLHYYLWRPAQRKMIEIYTFARAIVSPTKEDFKNAYDKVWWRFEEYYLQFYRSTVVNTSKKVGSSKRNGAIVTGLIFAGIIAAAIYPAIKKGSAITKPASHAVSSAPASTVAPTVSATNPASLVNFTSAPAQTLAQSYYQAPPPQPKLVAGVIRMSNRCHAFYTDDTPADISQAECMQYATRKKPLALKTPQASYQPTYQPQAPQSSPAPVIDPQQIAVATDQLNPVKLQKFDHSPQSAVAGTH